MVNPNLVLGERTVEGWEISGSTEIKENFIRLTPDKKDKTGYLKSNYHTDFKRSFVASMKFRISGQENLYGNGIGLFYLNKRDYLNV